jgi:hypothetical protein
MLQIRPNCECCDVDLPANSKDAFICSFECTFCENCVETKLLGKCPNCLGELVRRPIRSERQLLSHPASQKRIKKEHFY